MEEFKNNLVSFVSTSEKPILFEAFVTDEDESDVKPGTVSYADKKTLHIKTGKAYYCSDIVGVYSQMGGNMGQSAAF